MLEVFNLVHDREGFQQIFIGFWLYTFEVSSSKRKVDTYYVDLYEAVFIYTRRGYPG